MIEYESTEFEIKSKDFRAGRYCVIDVSNDPHWADVKAVEKHWNPKGAFTGSVNHRQRNYAEACEALESLGATRLNT